VFSYAPKTPLTEAFYLSHRTPSMNASTHGSKIATDFRVYEVVTRLTKS